MKIKKVLLISPPNYAFIISEVINFNINFPLGMAYIAAIAEQEGHDVKTIDCVAEGWQTQFKLKDGRVRVGLSAEEIENRVKEHSPDIVGISNLFLVQAEAANEVADIVKKVSKKIITVIGGAQATSQPKETLMCQNIDYVVMGEGEIIFKRLLQHLDNQKDIDEVPGIAYRLPNGDIKINQRAAYITNLDSLPFPARHLFDMEKYFNQYNSHGTRKYPRYASVNTSRGCPLKCTFCNVHDLSGRKYRYRSPENIIQELKLLKETYGVKEILMEDDNLTANRERARHLFQMMKDAKLDMEWDTPNGVAVFALDNDLLDLMKSSGCYKINLAIESADQAVIKNIIKKTLNLEKAISLINHAKKIGLNVQSYFIVGLPGTTLEQMRKNFHFMRKYKMYESHTSIFVPYPGTELYNVCLEKGYFAPNFDLRYATPAHCYLNTPEWKAKDVERLVEKEHFKNSILFYLYNPSRIQYALKKSTAISFIKKLFHIAFPGNSQGSSKEFLRA